jgi:hypothetical protein
MWRHPVEKLSLFYQSIEWNHGHRVNHIGVPPDVFPASSLRGTSMIRLYCLPKTMNQNPVTLIKINGLQGCASHDSTVPKGIDDSQLTLGRKMPNKRLPTSMGAIRTSTSRELVAVGRFHYPRGCRKSSIGGSGTFRTAESNSAE